MTIAILPAQLANQIAAGEVVERPASVIKELIENSLDAGATSIDVDIDKGGIKKIKITDNGSGIPKEELALALSRHATSKIKDLGDLEAINSLGFRGEALASISSVARLTLTSKTQEQSTAWQANAHGRDMSVDVLPAAHPNGTTIEVLDLFFNTPARRKFLRTEKTEFNHIDEVVRRIALARFDVSFTLSHNGKRMRQYRAANTQAQFSKRVAMVCGQKFIEQAIEIDCPHDNMKLSGWLAKPSFSRNQNDLCYSYVNGRMMRDKLINHAIRQAYADLLPADSYPAFVLFLELDAKEVDVNVHPAKHEVRFHQSRYIHDFIYSVCHKALMAENVMFEDDSAPEYHSTQSAGYQSPSDIQAKKEVSYQRPDYIAPLQQVQQSNVSYQQQTQSYSADRPSRLAVQNFTDLMTPIQGGSEPIVDYEARQSTLALPVNSSIEGEFFISVTAPGYGLYQEGDDVRLLSLFKLAQSINADVVLQSWQQSAENSLVSQPLLLPVLLTLSEQQFSLVKNQQQLFEQAGIFLHIKEQHKIQIRQFPALLRDQDVNRSFTVIVDCLLANKQESHETENVRADFIKAIASAMVLKEYSKLQAEKLLVQAKNQLKEQLSQRLTLNSVCLDLTSHIKQLL